MTYRLYGEDGSGSGVVEMALAAIGAEHEVHGVSLADNAQRASAYANLNAHRKLPTLVTPGGETLTETLAILLVLDERHPNAQLFPAPRSPERAQALRWLAFVATELYPIVEINDYPERFVPAPARASEMREVARRIWRERWLLVESAIAGQPWLLPSGFCFTDVYIAVVSRWAQQTEWREQHLPKVEAIAASMGALDRIGEVWKRHRGG